MKKLKVSLKKLKLSKSKVASFDANQVAGGYLFELTDNGCGPEYSVWPDICPVSHNCPPPTHTCQTVNCNSFACESIVCHSAVCNQTVGCTSPTLEC
ncbi:hypothetical protein [Kordia jejudonensis]|uniref:hypothetical protein n=1 Tax=Kordia jejudonensis TaxID=1348245 RepID=UPI000628FCDA|nr:hypothetical protein [Kordia jejudonensis]